MTRHLWTAAAIALAASVSIQAQQAVTIQVNPDQVVGEISPYIYGANQADWPGAKYLTLRRSGGNRMTAYNWENNASNAGSDWQHQSDSFLGGGDTPGEAIRSFADEVLSQGQTALVTIPMTDYVAADKKADGDVNKTPNYLETRFDRNLPRKDGEFAYPPDLTDKRVYQDEFVAWLENTFADEQQAPGADIWYALDNEPDLWAHTHARIHPDPVTYAEMIDRTTRWAGAIKDVAPEAQVFGFVSYGFNGFRSLQDAPDANGRDFVEFFLQQMKQAEEQSGRRLVDVLDLHWYPEARGDDQRVTQADVTPGVVAARVQAPRSLYDPDYRETSWIDEVLKEPIRLIPRIREKIEAHYPGTKLAFTEYNFGAGQHISGGLAQADVLGIFGREGVYAAAFWSLQGDNRYIYSAFDAYRNYDGQGARFGDLSLQTTSSDPEQVTAYASKFSEAGKPIVMVVVNKSNQPQPCAITLGDDAAEITGIYRFGNNRPELLQVEVPDDTATLTLPPMTVSTLVLSAPDGQ